MANNDLLDILKLEADEIEHSFKKAQIAGKGTPQEIADFREAFIANFLSRYFPFPYKIAKGKIRDSFGEVSSSIDCIVLHPNHPHTIDTAGKHSIIFCDGVDSAIELKPDIQNRNELIRSLKKIESVKNLRRFQSSIINNIYPRKPDDLVNFAYQIPSFIFATKCKTDPRDTAYEIKNYYESENIEKEKQIDAIIINKVGIIMNHKVLRWAPINTITKEKEMGLLFEEWGENTLARFLLLLNLAPGADIKISEPILLRYLHPLPSTNIYTI